MLSSEDSTSQDENIL